MRHCKSEPGKCGNVPSLLLLFLIHNQAAMVCLASWLHPCSGFDLASIASFILMPQFPSAISFIWVTSDNTCHECPHLTNGHRAPGTSSA